MVAIERDGALLFNSYRKSAKSRNFLRDPRAAAVLLDDWQAPPAAARVVTGDLEQIDGGADAPRAGEGHGEAHAAPDYVVERVQRRVETGKRVFFRLRTER